MTLLERSNGQQGAAYDLVGTSEVLPPDSPNGHVSDPTEKTSSPEIPGPGAQLALSGLHEVITQPLDDYSEAELQQTDSPNGHASSPSKAEQTNNGQSSSTPAEPEERAYIPRYSRGLPDPLHEERVLGTEPSFATITDALAKERDSSIPLDREDQLTLMGILDAYIGATSDEPLSRRRARAAQDLRKHVKGQTTFSL